MVPGLLLGIYLAVVVVLKLACLFFYLLGDGMRAKELGWWMLVIYFWPIAAVIYGYRFLRDFPW